MPIWVGQRGYVIYFSLLSTVPFTIIIVTTAWTYVFTRNFLKKDFERRRAMSNGGQDQIHEKSVYSVRIRNLIGIFGMLLLFNLITFSPYVVTSIIGLIVGLKKIPPWAYALSLILFLLNNVTNSLIQSYFRRDLRDTIVKLKKTIVVFISKPCAKWRKTDTQDDLQRDHSRSLDTKLQDSKDGTCDTKKGFSETVEVSLESQSVLCEDAKASEIDPNRVAVKKEQDFTSEKTEQ